MTKFGNDLKENLKLIAENPSIIKQLDTNNFQENRVLSEILNAKPEFYIYLDNNQMNDDAYIAMLEVNILKYLEIPKKNRTLNVKLHALKIDISAIAMFDASEINYEIVKYVYKNEPGILEDLDNDVKIVASKFIKKLKMQKFAAGKNENMDLLNER